MILLVVLAAVAFGWLGFLYGEARGSRQGRAEVAAFIRGPIIGGHAPYWCLEADALIEQHGMSEPTAKETRDEANAVLDAIMAYCDSVAVGLVEPET